ncbi:MAG: TIGR03790 family protein [Verrucomicrobiota bacterium]|nr:TIGR03790 family protein [Verrucomicrobiota bacterium]
MFLIAFAQPARAEEPLATSTLVVFNSDIPESAALAKFYAQKRGIARDHLIGLACPKEEEISREEYDNTIAEPLRAMFATKHWWALRDEEQPERGLDTNSIRFVALIKGMPLKIRGATAYPGDKANDTPTGGRNEASVDSELATLGRFSRQISGPVLNGYFKSYRSIAEYGEPALMLVCRLDAPTAETVRRMIVDSIAAEKNGLWGRAYVDGAHNTAGGLEIGDTWLQEIYDQLHKAGIPVVYEDTPALFPAGYPMSDCALYYGWYSSNVAGPFTQPDFHFVPGAVAVHIHSFSASTLRDPDANWVAPLLTKGAAASLGNVYEPYLGLTANLNIFNDRLLHGFTFAESAYMSVRGLSWMSVMVGDPLYRPYASWLQIGAKRDTGKSSSVWKMYHEFALKNSNRPPSEFRTLAREAASRAGNGPMIEDLGLMEAREGNFAAATSYFQQARASYSKRDDILRVVLEEANSWIKQDNPKRALTLVRNVLRIISDAPASVLLRQIEQDLSPTAPTPTPPKP